MRGVKTRLTGHEKLYLEGMIRKFDRAMETSSPADLERFVYSWDHSVSVERDVFRETGRVVEELEER